MLLAYCKKVINKPTKGDYEAFSALTYQFENTNADPYKLAAIINAGYSITTQHTGGKNCKVTFQGTPEQISKSRNSHKCEHTVKPGLTHRHQSNFTAAQYIGLDFDNIPDNNIEALLAQDFISKYYCIWYHTPSSTANAPRIRILFQLDKPITDSKLYSQYVQAVMWNVGAGSDPSCKDPCRIFYGCKDSQPVVRADMFLKESTLAALKEVWEVETAEAQPNFVANAPITSIRTNSNNNLAIKSRVTIEELDDASRSANGFLKGCRQAAWTDYGEWVRWASWANALNRAFNTDFFYNEFANASRRHPSYNSSEDEHKLTYDFTQLHKTSCSFEHLGLGYDIQTKRAFDPHNPELGDYKKGKKLLFNSPNATVKNSTGEVKPTTEKENTNNLIVLQPDSAGNRHFTDTGNGYRLVDEHGENIRHSSKIGWLTWDGKRWRKDAEKTLYRMAKETVFNLYQQGLAEANEDTRKAMIKWALSSEGQNALDRMIKNASSIADIDIDVEEFDKNPWQFNCQNGVLDLQTGQLVEHSKNHYMSKISLISYNPDAKCPAWEKYLEGIFKGNYNLINFIQRAVGYSLTGSVKEQCFFILHGDGSNGKSTMIEALNRIWGEYSETSNVETFLETTKGTSSSARPDLAKLAGTRLVTASENEANSKLSAALLKSLTGGDKFTARFLHQNEFSFYPQLKLWLATNHKPQIRNQDYGIWRRIHLIPFDVQFSEDQKDKELPEKLEREAEGILAWAVRGCLAWQQQGLQPPEEVKAATSEYKADSDSLRDYIAERCKTWTGLSGYHAVEFSKLYKDYADYCNEYGEVKLGKKVFAEAMRLKNFHTLVGNANKRYTVGITLLSGHGD